MALLNVGEVVAAVAALFDDPAQSEIDKDYVIPFLNLRWANLTVNLVMLGLQYSEEVVEFTIPAGTVDLSTFMGPDQPLASLMKPKSIDWKLVGDPDTSFTPADLVNELDDEDQSSQGILEYSWQGGTIQVTPSAVDVIARVRFQAMSTNLIDPSDGMIRGACDLLAFRTAELMAGVRGMPALKANCKEWGDTALDDFCAMSVMALQGQLITMPATHPRGYSSLGRFVARVSASN